MLLGLRRRHHDARARGVRLAHDGRVERPRDGGDALVQRAEPGAEALPEDPPPQAEAQRTEGVAQAPEAAVTEGGAAEDPEESAKAPRLTKEASKRLSNAGKQLLQGAFPARYCPTLGAAKSASRSRLPVY